MNFSIYGNLIDIHVREIYPACINVANGIISSIEKIDTPQKNFILPGFVDSHIHIESSMIIPSEFAKVAVNHGTVATVSDPHEIANVCGIDGVNFMIENGEQTPFKFYFGAPSCVPATSFETSGASISASEIDLLLSNPKIKYLSEMMNFPGVIYQDKEVHAKLDIAKKYAKPIDGHAPGLTGEIAEKYAAAGITTDHECYSIDEALFKIGLGMKILIREGSAAKNFDELSDLIDSHTNMVMLCSDDCHPDNLIEGHINLLVKKALQKGYNLFNILQAAILNPIKHYKLDVGSLKVNDPADFIIIDNPQNFNILSTYINGIKVAENGVALFDFNSTKEINNFNCDKITESQIKVQYKGGNINVIGVTDGQLITQKINITPKVENGEIIADLSNDILKLVVYNRYQKSVPAVAFIKNIGLKKGALCTTVAHDSHNIIAVGTNDLDIVNAINLVIDNKGGMSIANGEESYIQPLNIAGIMSNQSAKTVADKYKLLTMKAKELGTELNSPFMTLSFMSLLVIPSIKLSDKGLFDGDKFEFIQD